uniref:Uncharacterized protein n=1 Tax=Mola mola TaxID=94237 RepID=A0A3Q4APF9_MOLML
MDLDTGTYEPGFWGAVPPKKVDTLKGPAQKVVIHLSIQRSHMTERNFDDIGYNFLIGADGTVYEGRGWDVSGAHAKGNNHDSLGVAFMGNFNIDAPSMEAVSAVKLLLQSGVSQGLLHPDFVLKGHRDLDQTECPGEKLYVTLSKLK